ncbi:hypothetical protein MKW92_051917 [Papaver armeniacum]|nr:hypothetical protein MKW92_051917 [Papaver armeniacum]
MEAIKYSNTTNAEDNISNLPDFLIHHILSFVKVKQAVQTCILSKRWRYIWTSLPFLNFDESDLPQSYRVNYYLDRLVENVLSLRDNRCFDLRRFHLIGGHGACMSISNLCRWIIGVVRSNVEDIYVQFNGFDGSYNNDRKFRVPDCVFTCKSLTKLELDLSSYCKIILPNSLSLPRLRYLKLNNPSFDHDELTKLCAPNLVYLVLSNLDYMLLEDVSSLVTADVGVQLKPRKLNAKFWRIHAPDTLKSLKSLHNVKDLTISLRPLKDVRRVQELLQEQPFQFCNLQRLKLQKISLSTDSVHAIASLVKVSPIIESIKLELCQDVETSYKYNCNYSESDSCSEPHTSEVGSHE